MLLILVPGCALPLIVFGYFAIDSHFKSLVEKHNTHLANVLGFLNNDFEQKIADAGQQLTRLALLTSDDAESLTKARKKIANWMQNNESFDRFYFYDVENIQKFSQPDFPSLIPEDLKWARIKQGIFVSEIQTDQDQNKTYLLVRCSVMQKDKLVGYLVGRLDMLTWLSKASDLLGRKIGVVAAIIPNDVNSTAIRIGDFTDGWWTMLANLRSKPGFSGVATLQGSEYLVSQWEMKVLGARFAVAYPSSKILSTPRRIMYASGGILVFILVLWTGLVRFTSQTIIGPVVAVADAAEKFTVGDRADPIVSNSEDELDRLVHSFNKMTTEINSSQFRMKAMYHTIRELFGCDNLNAILCKGVEILCSHGNAQVAWFVPSDPGRQINSAQRNGLGLNIWVYKDRHVYNANADDANAAWERIDGDRVYTFVMRNRSGELGTLKVAYLKQPLAIVESLLHSLVSLVETAIEKQELIHENAVVSTELEIAETVQRNMLSKEMLESKQARIAYHYKPSSNLGGEWFFLVEDASNESLWVMMGNATGRGLLQGMVTTAVKGALDVIHEMIIQGDGHIRSPSQVVAMLNSVVTKSIGKNNLSMSCVVVKVDFRLSTLLTCNAGHTLPIHIRHRDGVSWARHLQKNVQPILGLSEDPPFKYEDTKAELKPDDLLVVYTDGLGDAKTLDSKVFGRFLFRKLRQRRDFATADTLKSEVLEMFNYYTQGAVINEDVRFLIIQMNPMNLHSGRKNVS